VSIGLAVALSALTALALAILLAPLFLRRRGPASNHCCQTGRDEVRQDLRLHNIVYEGQR